MVLDGKTSQEYPVNVVVSQGPFLGPTLFLLYINNLHDDLICNIAIYADDTILYPLPILIILLSTLIVIRHLICGNN